MTDDTANALSVAAYGKAVDFRDHHRYATREQALLAPRRNCPGHAAADYATEFDRSVALLEQAHGLVNNHLELLRRRWQAMPPGSDPKELDVSDLVPLLAERCPGFSEVRCRDTLLWKFIWYELR